MRCSYCNEDVSISSLYVLEKAKHGKNIICERCLNNFGLENKQYHPLEYDYRSNGITGDAQLNSINYNIYRTNKML